MRRHQLQGFFKIGMKLFNSQVETCRRSDASTCFRASWCYSSATTHVNLRRTGWGKRLMRFLLGSLIPAFCRIKNPGWEHSYRSPHHSITPLPNEATGVYVNCTHSMTTIIAGKNIIPHWCCLNRSHKRYPGN